MKTRMVSLLALACLIFVFRFIAAAPAAPNQANPRATPAASALPATPAQLRRNGIRKSAKRSNPCAGRKHTWNTPPMTSVATAWKPSRPPNQAIKQLELCLKFDKD